MLLEVTREVFTDKSTIGILRIGDKFVCHTLEDVDRKLEDGGAKIPGVTAIPRGTYHVIISYSKRFRAYMPEVLGVPGFRGVRIHSGNTDKETEGCILVGTTRGPNAIYSSKLAYSRLLPLIEDQLDSHRNVELCIK